MYNLEQQINENLVKLDNELLISPEQYKEVKEMINKYDGKNKKEYLERSHKLIKKISWS